MAEVSSPVEVLRAAAGRLDELAESTSPAPWSPVQLYADAWSVEDAEGWELAQESQDGDLTEPDARWIASLGPQVAPALSTWLRTTATTLAERLEVLDRNPGRYQGAAEAHADALARVHGFYEPALRFAGLVLGLPAAGVVSDTTGEGQ